MKTKYYIAKDANFPESDLWCEMTGTACGDPQLQICGRNEQGDKTILNLKLAEAQRLERILAEKFLRYSSSYMQKSEE